VKVREGITPEQVISRVAVEARNGKPVYWPQPLVRRAYEAMLKSQSHDLLVLARAALQAAIRSEADLRELLSSAPLSAGSAVSSRLKLQANPSDLTMTAW
jgi:hypothetical protein